MYICIPDLISKNNMESSIYSFALGIALPLMLFFGFYFLFAKAPEKVIFENYLRSRRIMGLAILILAANYSVHLFLEIRFLNANAAILMNQSTYFLCYGLFSSAMITLLDRFYITRRRSCTQIILWIIFSALSAVVLFVLPEGRIQKIGLMAAAFCLVAYGLVLSRRIISAYRKASRLFEETHSDDIGAYISWMSVFTYWAVIFGVGCGLLTFLPVRFIYIWILSSVPFYIYLFCSYMNYMLFYEQVEQAIEQEEMPLEDNPSAENDMDGVTCGQERTAFHAEIDERTKKWIAADGFVHPGLTLKDLAETLHTNRTYLSSYIRTEYNMTFRDWIAGLRIGYAKHMLVGSPELSVSEISWKSGFQSPSHFIRLFRERSGCSPAKWRKMVPESDDLLGKTVFQGTDDPDVGGKPVH